ncbi:hypothetical protein Hypma_005467 [Hypsizygus marmoreus]|uniref:Uncharacterized protein n=1 Tax=Hypsizygus marmoreus TaxID=39966 RepID=A0A369J1R2_HYPMA|nr:hypothetical protein Hypma_005467 [Hypsizygus marmoreus]
MASADITYENMTVEDFCHVANSLLTTPDQHADFAQLVLTGRYEGSQAVIDPIANRMDDDEALSALRDYDSLLGLHPNIVVSTPVMVYPVPKKEDTLTKNIHVSSHFTNSRGPFTAPVHTIPNCCIGKWGTHNTLRVLIPELHHDQRSSQSLSQDELRIFYEKGLRPAVQQLLGDQAAEWPATYADEMFRARGRNGQLSFQTKVIPEWHLSELGDCIRACLAQNGCSWGNGMVFLHQIRGVKHSSSHNLDHDASQQAFEAFIADNNLDLTAIQSTGDWWIDVGVEISSEEANCLAWRTDSHFHIVKQVCDLADHVAARITAPGSSKYTRDMVSHLPAVSGCRISPGPRARGRFDVEYLQMYTTDKSLTYRQDQGHYGKFITCKDVLNGRSKEYIQNLYQLYRNAIRSNYSLARVEVRVPLRHACTVLLDLGEELVRGSLVSFTRTVWWSLRSYRALGLKFILEWQNDGDKSHRRTKEALLLTAGATWLLNGLHSTPDKGASSKDLMAAILPHVESAGADPDILAYGSPTADDDVDSEADTDSEDEDGPARVRQRRDAVTIPAFPYGMVFLRRIRVGVAYPVPRFNRGPQFLSQKSFRYFFGVDFAEVDTEFFGAGLVVPRDPTRVQNKTRRTLVWYNWGQESEDKIFHLVDRGYAMNPGDHDEGSDVEMDKEAEEEDATKQFSDMDLDTALTWIYRQFLLDVTSKAPNRLLTQEKSYCILTTEQRTRVTEATYKNERLSEYFRDCQWKVVGAKHWQLIFDRFFPPKGKKLPSSSQNYRSMKYFLLWDDLRGKTDAATFYRIRGEIKARFDKLYWMPFAQTDRVWWTKFDKTFTKSSGLPRLDASPLVFVNRRAPTW